MKAKNKTLLDINTILIALLVIVMAAGLYFTLSTPGPKAPPAAAKPLMVSVTVLGSDCEKCWNVGTALDFLGKQANIKISDVKNLTIAESSDLASAHNITHLPALVITGETQNLTIQNFEKDGNDLVFAQSPPPYYDLSAKTYRGKVQMTILDEQNCAICFNMSNLVEQLEQSGIAITSKKMLKPSSTEGKQLMGKYHVEKLPTVILSKDALEYPFIADVWKQVGSQETDGTLVLRTVYPPYVNVSSGNIQGQVSLTILEDTKCTECYNTSVLSELFSKGLNIAVKDTMRVDLSGAKGKLLVKKYNISLVPTVIASKDASEYPTVLDVWPQLGTSEKDGSFVLRNVPLLEKAIGSPIKFRNLTSGMMQDSSVAANATEAADISAPTADE